MKNIARMGLLLIATLAGAGCTPKVVLVPVSSCPAPPSFSMPTLLVDNLTTTATTRDKLQAVKIDHGTMRKALQECIVIVDSYRTIPTTNPTQ